MDLPKIPRRTKEYIEFGAPEGTRNAALFNAACQLRDAQWPQHVLEDVLMRRARLDGLTDQEARASIRSVMASPARTPISEGRPRPMPTTYSIKDNFEPEPEPIVYALDESDEIPEPIENPSVTFLQTVFSPEDKIQIVVGNKNEEGQEMPIGASPILPRDQWIKKIEAKGGKAQDLFPAVNADGPINQGLYIAINPIRDVKDGRKKRNIARYQYALIEFDTISTKQQWQLIKKSRIPCATVCFSGNKSLHALVRVDARTLEEYDARVEQLMTHFSEYEVDTQNRDPSRLSRLPGCVRGDTNKEQTLLAINIGAKNWKEWETHLTDNFPSILTQEEFYNEDISEPPPIIDGLLNRQLSLVIGGSSKTYKSWTLLDMAISTANGIPFWGFNTHPGKCLYINFEIPEYYMRERVKAICDAKGLDMPSDNLYIWNLRGRAQALEAIRPKFTKVMANANFAMVILDPIYKTLGNRDENAAGDINSLMNEMEHLALETGAAVVFATHFSKGNQAQKSSIDRISGSGVFARSPDTILVMTEHEEDHCFTVESTVRNYETPKPFVVKMDFPLFKREEELDPAKLKKPGGRPADDIMPDIMEILVETNDWVMQADLVTRMTEMGQSATTVKRQVQKGVKDGLILREKADGRSYKLKKNDKIVVKF